METPLRVLVVDDEQDVEWLFRQRLRKEVRGGLVDLHFAHSGEAALDYLRDGEGASVVLVLSDINMPGMTGLELLKRIKAAYPTLPVHMITAYGDEATHQVALAYGANGYLTKPLDFVALKREVLGL